MTVAAPPPAQDAQDVRLQQPELPQAVDQPPTPDAPIESIVGAEQNNTMESFLQLIMEDLEVVWRPWFIENGWYEPDLYYSIVTPGFFDTVACQDPMTGAQPFPVGSDYPNVFYCPSSAGPDANGNYYDGGLYLPVDMMIAIYTGAALGNAPGDFAVAYTVAHEYGHHIVDEMVKQSEVMGAPYVRPENPPNELLADCLAGVWANTVYGRGFLEDGDIVEGLSMAYASSDDVRGTPLTHGYATHRMGAFMLGYAGMSDGSYTAGDPGACFDWYWLADENWDRNYAPYTQVEFPTYSE